MRNYIRDLIYTMLRRNRPECDFMIISQTAYVWIIERTYAQETRVCNVKSMNPKWLWNYAQQFQTSTFKQCQNMSLIYERASNIQILYEWQDWIIFPKNALGQAKVSTICSDPKHFSTSKNVFMHMNFAVGFCIYTLYDQICAYARFINEAPAIVFLCWCRYISILGSLKMLQRQLYSHRKNSNKRSRTVNCSWVFIKP